MTRIAYLDCVGGLAGDMLLAALLDAGAPEEVLHALPERLGLPGVAVRVERVERHGIKAVHVDVIFEGGGLAGPPPSPQRSWPSIRDQVVGAPLDEAVRARALAVLGRLAKVEAEIHGVSVEEVHFHELSAADTLVDVVGAVTLLAELGVERVVCSPLPLGRGTVAAAHGVLPLPAPATARLLQGAPVVGVELEAETVTPTGAALATVLAGAWGRIPAMTLERDGFGAGTADFAERANVVRVLLGSADVEPARLAEVVLLETNLDDLLPEFVPDAAERCLAAGALDVWTTPATMKKGRPGVILSALARPGNQNPVAQAILEHTSALGVRFRPMHRYELEREWRSVEVDGHEVRVKLGRLDGRVVNVAPEHDDCAAVAEATGRPIKSIWAEALAGARELL